MTPAGTWKRRSPWHAESGALISRSVVWPIWRLRHRFSELSAAEALQLSEQAAAVAEVHGLDADPVAALAFAVGAGSLAWLGRFDEGEQWLARAQRALRPEVSPGTELAAHHARGLLRFGQGRVSDALDAFRSAEKMQASLSGQHALTVDLRMRMVLAQLRLGEPRGREGDARGASPRTVWCGPKPASRRPRWSSRRIGPSRRSSCSHP